jgi:drug/metabolite transporter (DMT)-like permease
MVLVSAAAFGTLAILAKLAYAAGLRLEQLLAFRFLFAAAGMIALAVATRQSPFSIDRRRFAALAAMGVVGYSGQAFTFFSALRQLPASLVELVLYSYPALVALAGWALFRSIISRAHVLALVASFAGVGLLLGGVTFAAGPALLFAITSPVLYSAYILVGDRVMPGVPPLAASAVTVSGSALTFSAVAAAQGALVAPPSAVGWALVVALAVLPTMVAITLFLAALPRVGGSRAALLSTCEPLVTVALAVALLGDRFGPVQVVGGLLVLGAVAVLQWPRGRRR